MFRLRQLIVCAVVFLAPMVSAALQAHPGRTDSKGGHYNRKTGSYHFHSSGGTPAPVAPRTTARLVPRTTARTTVRTVAKEPVLPDNAPVATPTEFKITFPNIHLETHRYTVYLTSGREIPISAYEERPRSYKIVGTGGGSIAYPQRMISRIEPTMLDPAGGLPATAVVAEVIATNAILLENDQQVQLIGVGTPATARPQPPAKQVLDQLNQLTRKLLEGQTVQLLYDQHNVRAGHRNADDQLLAYVILIKDDLDANAEMIYRGYAPVDTHSKFTRLEEFRDYEQNARKAHYGLWSH